MPLLQVVWLVIGFVPAVIADKPPIPVVMGDGAVFADQSRCETVAQDRRNKFLEAGHQPEDALIRCMPYWIDKQTASAIHKRHRS